MEIHKEVVLKSVKEAISNGVKVIMTMDNLDIQFYFPSYFKKYCSPFYKRSALVLTDDNSKALPLAKN